MEKDEGEVWMLLQHLKEEYRLSEVKATGNRGPCKHLKVDPI
jgi:hypothetical protein